MTCDNVLNPAIRTRPTTSTGALAIWSRSWKRTAMSNQGRPRTLLAAPPDLITHVAVGPWTFTTDPRSNPPWLTQKLAGIKPKVVLADSHYGSNENLEEAKARQDLVVSINAAQGEQARETDTRTNATKIAHECLTREQLVAY